MRLTDRLGGLILGGSFALGAQSIASAAMFLLSGFAVRLVPIGQHGTSPGR
jgi:hypothetical protein